MTEPSLRHSVQVACLICREHGELTRQSYNEPDDVWLLRSQRTWDRHLALAHRQPLTEAQSTAYMADQGAHCPFCKAGPGVLRYEDDPIQFASDWITRINVCQNCGGRLVEHYRLDHITEDN